MRKDTVVCRPKRLKFRNETILALYTILQIAAYIDGLGNIERPCTPLIPCGSITSRNSNVIDLIPKISNRMMTSRAFNRKSEEMLMCSLPACLSNPCLNGETCVETMVGYRCESSVCYSDCNAALDAAHRVDGVYRICFITSDGVYKGPYSVWCRYDETFHIGWLVIQRRYGGSVNFERPWEDYKHGFGNISTEFRLGNDLIHDLTSSRTFLLRISMWSEDGSYYHVRYHPFRVGDEGSGYQLHLCRRTCGT
ncbi:angiopoietin-1-like [Lytechinus variegatus]|uniref:angiopoietin-1-like n=1 Tax=Lytechinus variegatus TaxID=7654 RepID=UPI001BB1B514|nr:angiopoietin-1-like [Lytechinus variegatus]